MKITNIETFPVWGGFRNFLFVVVDTDEGIYGVGEAGLTGRELAVIGAIEHFKPLLIGQDPARIEHIWQMLSRGGFFPAQRIVTSAISAIDIALWDIKGKALGVPIYDLLGGRVRDRVVCYPHNGGATCPIWWNRAKRGGGLEVRALGPAEEDSLLSRAVPCRQAIEQFQAVREAVGEEIEITFDVHTRLICPTPSPFPRGRGVSPLLHGRSVALRKPRLLQDPAPAHLGPLAAGEQFSSKWEFRQLIEEEWIDYARVDMCIVGGFTEARKIAGWCETHYIKMAVHNPLGPISSAACLQFNLAVPNFGVQEQPRKPATP